MSLLSVASLIFFVVGTAAATSNGWSDTKPSKEDVLRYPFAPPSKEFCSSNELGDDAYVSIFEPCNFIFHHELPHTVPSYLPEGTHFSCGDYRHSEPIKFEQRKVIMWPDSCVAAGPRCYSIADHPDLANYTAFAETDYAMDFPPGAAIVSVDCQSDYAKAQEFMENLPEQLPAAIDALTSAGRALLFAGVAFLLMGLCCCVNCFRMCFCPDGQKRNSYTAIPVVSAVPVSVTKEERLV